MRIHHTLFLAIVLLLASLSVYGNINISEYEDKTLSLAFIKQNYSLNFLHEINHLESHLHSALFSSLLISNPNTLKPDVGLAISWFVNKDKDEFTFNLRKGAKFSDGTLIKSADVKASWIAAIQARNAFSYLFELIQGVSDYYNGIGTIEDIQIIVVNESVLRISLKEPAPYFLSTLTHSSFSITSRAQLAKKGSWDEQYQDIISSGPYVVEEKYDDMLVLKKNEEYWDKDSVYFEKINVKFYSGDEEENIIDDVNENRIQWSTFYRETEEEGQENTLKDKDWLLVHPLFGSEYLFFGDTQKEPWNNANVRTALKLLLPLRKFLNEEYSFPAASFVPPITGIYEPDFEFPNQDTGLALEMLKDEGYPQGKGLGKIVLLASEFDDGSYREVFDMVKEHIEQNLDTAVEIKKVPARDYHDKIQTETFTLAITGWIGDFADPAAFLQMWASPNASLGHNYDNKEYQEIISKSNLTDSKLRFDLLYAAERILLDTTVVIPLRRIVSTNIVRTDKIYGWNTNILDIHPFGAIYKERVKMIPRLTLHTHTQFLQ